MILSENGRKLDKLPEDLKNVKNSSSFKSGLRQRRKQNEQRQWIDNTDARYEKRETKNTKEKIENKQTTLLPREQPLKLSG